MTPLPIRVFRIRPEPRSRLSIQVEIFRTVGEFRAFNREEDRQYGQRVQRTRGLVGMCMGVTERRRQRKTGLFAVIRLPRRHLTMSTITHEAFHATCRWAERRGILMIPTNNPDHDIWKRASSIEERCATVHDTICRKIVTQLNRHRLIPT